jgi:hypothetical protein
VKPVPGPRTPIESQHADHQNWIRENALWRDEIRCWQHQLKTALKNLGTLHDAIKEQEKNLSVHAAAIRVCEQELGAHEHVLAIATQQGGQLPTTESLEHSREAARHAAQQHAHERLKQHHHKVMKQWNALVIALAIDD